MFVFAMVGERRLYFQSIAKTDLRNLFFVCDIKDVLFAANRAYGAKFAVFDGVRHCFRHKKSRVGDLCDQSVTAKVQGIVLRACIQFVFDDFNGRFRLVVRAFFVRTYKLLYGAGLAVLNRVVSSADAQLSAAARTSGSVSQLVHLPSASSSAAVEAFPVPAVSAEQIR